MFSELGQFIRDESATIVPICLFGSLVMAYALLTSRRKDDKHIDLRDLIWDTRKQRIDYKKLAINTCAVLQCFTWWRMSMGYEVHSALQDPWMWLIFYAVVAGHDLLERIVRIKAAQTGVLNAVTDNSATDHQNADKQ